MKQEFDHVHVLLQELGQHHHVHTYDSATLPVLIKYVAVSWVDEARSKGMHVEQCDITPRTRIRGGKVMYRVPSPGHLPPECKASCRSTVDHVM